MPLVIQNTTDWIFRVGDGKNLIRSSKHKIWGIKVEEHPPGKNFSTHVKPGDRLWFVTSKSHGKLVAVATYVSHNKRQLGPLIDISLTNEELGWTNENSDWISDTEIHYTNLYDISHVNLLSQIHSPMTIREYNPEKCQVNLPIEYFHISKYCKPVNELSL